MARNGQAQAAAQRQGCELVAVNVATDCERSAPIAVAVADADRADAATPVFIIARCEKALDSKVSQLKKSLAIDQAFADEENAGLLFRQPVVLQGRRDETTFYWFGPAIHHSARTNVRVRTNRERHEDRARSLKMMQFEQRRS